ncbi:MAG: mRNA surveillance protein Pelota [Desulfurococcales archaeon]|nr:mRNA surveillance protein Pelota [Desulfurococcales archaeon]
MKIEVIDRRREKLRVRPESEEDLWALRVVLRPGDYVKGRTIRDVAKGGRGEKEKRPITVKIRVKNVEFQPFVGKLRIFGVIVEGPEEYGVKGKHQSILVSPGTELILERAGGWPETAIEKLKSSGPSGKAVIVAVDYDEYAIAITASYGVKIVVDNYIRLPGKDDPSREQEQQRIVEKIAMETVRTAADSGARVVIVAGPGPLKDQIAGKIRELAPHLTVIVDEASRGGRGGVDEVLRRPSVWRVLREYEITEAEELLSNLLREASRGGERIALGPREVLATALMGAVEKLVVVDELLYALDDDLRETVTRAVEEAEKRRARVIIVPRDSPVGERLYLMGGIAAILRYPVPHEARGSLLGASD